LNGCVGQGETCDEAVKELEENERVWLEMAEEDGETAPEHSIEKPIEYSGKLTVRLSRSLHRQAAERAKEENISLNSFIAEAVAEKIGNLSKKEVNAIRLIVKQCGNIITTINGVKNTIYDSRDNIKESRDLKFDINDLNSTYVYEPIKA
jgi:antitoxin HicB